MVCPCCAPVLNGAAFAVVPFAGFFGKAVSAKPSGTHQDVGVMVSVVAFGVGFVDGVIDGAAVLFGQLLGELADDAGAALAVYLGGQGDDDFSGDGAVFPLLCGFGGIPECGAFGSPLGGVGRQDDGALDDAFFVAVGVVMSVAER